MENRWQEITVSRAALFEEEDAEHSDGSSDISMRDLGQIEVVEKVVTQPDIAIENLDNGDGKESEDEALDFRLFTNSAAQVTVKSPSPVPESEAFTRAALPAAHLLTPRRRADGPVVQEVSASERQRFLDAAVSGLDILALSAKAWPACAMPWQVTSLVVSSRVAKKHKSGGISKAASQPPPESVITELKDGNPEKKPTKPGKKKRMVLRKRQEVVRLASVADREKRTRLNRAKKIKRKLKEKAKKAEAKAATGEVEASLEGSDSGESKQ